jgi:hypothetical protein
VAGLGFVVDATRKLALAASRLPHCRAEVAFAPLLIRVRMVYRGASAEVALRAFRFCPGSGGRRAHGTSPPLCAIACAAQ